MNFTVINLIYPLLLSQSPAFIGNHLSFAKSEFNKFTSILFYNQQSLYLQRSKFKDGTNGVIIQKNDNPEKYFIKTTYDATNFSSEFLSIIQKIENSSISIIDCSFIELHNSNSQSILIENGNVSLYMSDNIFYKCQSKEGVIRLQDCRCVTVTHTCSLESQSNSNIYFYYYDCKPEDFSIFLYSTIAESICTGHSSDNMFVSKCTSGNQYYRCNNFTTMKNGIQFDAPKCFSFAMNTILKCERSCFYFSGNYGNCNDFTPKEIQMVNFISQKNAIRLSSDCNQTITISNSVLQSETSKFYEYDSKKNIILILMNCFITPVQSETDEFINVTYVGCSPISYNPSGITIFPHYTRGEYCRGDPIEDETAKHGCNVGNCIDKICNYTIGFPSGVPQYKTFIHTDLQTASFTPSKEFTESSKFTNSQFFSKSNEFTNSYSFTNSEFVINGGGNQGKDDKGSDDKKKIGIIAGSVAAAAAVVGGGLAAFFLVKKRMGVKVEDDPTINNEKKPDFKVENDLDDIMDKDDPFADEFANH